MRVWAGSKGDSVTAATRTDYPFREKATIEINCHKPVSFPIYLRVPRWYQRFTLAINGKRMNIDSSPQQMVSISRTWRDGDRICIELPMDIEYTERPGNGSLSVHRGSLSYLLEIEETWKNMNRDDMDPEW